MKTGTKVQIADTCNLYKGRTATITQSMPKFCVVEIPSGTGNGTISMLVKVENLIELGDETRR
jgi:hypothetical protein